MNFELASNKLTGHPNNGGWAQIHDFTPAQGNLVKSHGHLIAVVSMERQSLAPSQPGLAKEVIEARNILGRLNQEYFGKTGPAFTSLKDAVSQVVKEFGSQKEKLSLLAVVFLDDAVFLAASGNVAAFVSRKGSFGQILKGNFEKVVAASGKISHQDSYLFTTTNLFELAPLKVVQASLANPSHQSFVENLAPKVHSSSNFATLGTYLVKIKPQAVSQKVAINPALQINAPPSPKINSYQPTTIAISPVRRSLAKVLDKAIAILPERRIFVRGENDFAPTHKKKMAVSIGLVLLVLLAVSIAFGAKQNASKFSKSKYEGKLIQAQHDFEEAKSLSLSSLNPSRARDLVLGAKTAVDDLNAQGVKDERLVALSQDIASGLGKIAGIYRQDSNFYFDLSLQTSGFIGDDIGISEGRIAALDKSKKVIISIKVDTKKAEIAAGPDTMPTALALAVYSDRNFVVSDDGIWTVGDKAEIAVKKDWDGDTLVAAYSGNIYVLEKGKNIVWRFAGDGGTFGTKQNWFGAGVSPDLSNVKGMAIDGSIWMLTNSGRVLKFSLGSPQEFTISNMDNPVASPTDIFTNDETQDIYILDSQNGRVVVVDKNGVFKAQYISDKLKEAKRIVVSEEDKKIIFLTGTKLFYLDIKHL
ncbi:MAG TPA: hypothetical protein VF185_02055 [Patescibacteria group bacterium]